MTECYSDGCTLKELSGRRRWRRPLSAASCVPDERALIHPHLLRRQQRAAGRDTISTACSHAAPYIAPLLIGWHLKASTLHIPILLVYVAART